MMIRAWPCVGALSGGVSVGVGGDATALNGRRFPVVRNAACPLLMFVVQAHRPDSPASRRRARQPTHQPTGRSDATRAMNEAFGSEASREQLASSRRACRRRVPISKRPRGGRGIDTKAHSPRCSFTDPHPCLFFHRDADIIRAEYKTHAHDVGVPPHIRRQRPHRLCVQSFAMSSTQQTPGRCRTE